MATNAERQAAFKARMRAEGKQQLTVWATATQVEAIKACLEGEPLPVTPKQPEKPAPTPVSVPVDKPKLAKVTPSKPDRLSEYVLWQGGKRLGRVWQVAEKPKWRGFPTGFNQQQYSGNSRQAVVERIQRYQRV